jgi:hypothetical protein
MSAIGRRQLRKMSATVLPELLGDPLRFLVERTISGADLPVVEKIEAMRADMAKRNREFVGVFEGDQLEAKSGRSKSLAEVAWVVSIVPLWGTFLYLCAKASAAKTILELGGGAGISGCYLASGPSCTRFVTIEGHPDRAQLAELHLRSVANDAEVVNASFEDGVRDVLPTLDGGIDLVFIDGARRWETMHGLLSRMTHSLERWNAPYLEEGLSVSGVWLRHQCWPIGCLRVEWRGRATQDRHAVRACGDRSLWRKATSEKGLVA